MSMITLRPTRAVTFMFMDIEAPPAELMRSAESLDEPRRNLDSETAERAWNEGRDMSADKAVAYALEGTG